MHFIQKTKFKELMEFRKLWNDMHKLDQDTIVPGLFREDFISIFLVAGSCGSQLILRYSSVCERSWLLDVKVTGPSGPF